VDDFLPLLFVFLAGLFLPRFSLPRKDLFLFFYLFFFLRTFLDFTDELSFLRSVPVLGFRGIGHEFFEDLVFGGGSAFFFFLWVFYGRR